LNEFVEQVFFRRLSALDANSAMRFAAVDSR
jgi:hypothetical protein